MPGLRRKASRVDEGASWCILSSLLQADVRRQDKSKIKEIQESITIHLASQGMIKGQARPIGLNRIPTQGEILRLSPPSVSQGMPLNGYSSGSSSSGDSPRETSVEADQHPEPPSCHPFDAYDPPYSHQGS